MRLKIVVALKKKRPLTKDSGAYYNTIYLRRYVHDAEPWCEKVNHKRKHATADYTYEIGAFRCRSVTDVRAAAAAAKTHRDDRDNTRTNGFRDSIDLEKRVKNKIRRPTVITRSFCRRLIPYCYHTHLQANCFGCDMSVTPQVKYIIYLL